MRALFLLDLGALVLSALVLAVLFAVSRRKKLIPAAPLGHGPGFWAAAGLAAVFLTVGGLAALDFQRAFVVFHTLFFPGKTNWIFDWRTDPIILFLPEAFFRNCALLILLLLVFWCAVLIAADLWAVRQRRRRAGEPPAPAARAAPAEKKASENVKKGLDILKKTAIIISAFKDSRLRCAEVLPRMQWSMI